ncbi:flavodoxin-dependent (E)-4-hydroxy-3-methylbut-2-enyl-diphosphate synthase [Desulfomonile tiedjei]|uniref:4-hydroxy-3-methylbut-2-en-1-yl diphosphate synthase (flavodoxin) n=1 Tax=Desulfomonile tiedjei (strain ATCC 49306 / DSM 6799 / DCB-1) TaxID=706587 RepID=I4C0W8_DESTA|nr:flavodoxin-dependent (E)-4-hydroxy-3-methylbut-2-enyl-diphosphate synthase [Desulfomonile tiedjei]AFM23209.1 1-hydroxy-2-methyl-2-(E)-butenyl 4-diphosphate synthase [Desulfomonile tiedjei DSM 6799]
MILPRRKTRRISIGNVPIGDFAPIAVQSMTNTDTRDAKTTLRQIRRLEKAGCEIVRLGVPDMDAARNLGTIKKGSSIPIIADIHFDYRLALEALKQGVDGLRLNPGNIRDGKKVREVTKAALERNVPIRIGVNAGSLDKDLIVKYGGSTPEAMVESALSHVDILEKAGFSLIKISLKASDVLRTVAAYSLLAQKVDYPLHVGITEAGTLLPGAIKSGVGIGLILSDGIGDTIRVSLTAAPEYEIQAAFSLLNALGLRRRGVEIISCPTCSRTEIDLIGLARKVEKALAGVRTPLKVAVMGCTVNGPGEAKEADIGIAGGKGRGIIFKDGKILGTFDEKDLFRALLDEIRHMTGEP